MSRQQRGYILAKEVVRTVIDAGPDGISARGVAEVISACNDVPADILSVRPLLSRMKREGVFLFSGGHYVAPNTLLASTT